MRIICPDCGAQYEVPDDAIPTDGRDVQCSNCNSTWFCEHPDNPGTAQRQTEDSTGPDQPPEEDAPEDEIPPPAPPRRDLDPKVASILREEARREKEARMAEGLETQPELGLTEGAAPVAEPARDREMPADTPTRPVAGTTAEPPPKEEPDRATVPSETSRGVTAERDTPHPDTPAPDTAKPTPRRDLLPDVEEINSSLRSTEARRLSRDDLYAEEDRADRRRGFRSGFLAAMVIFVVGVLVYQFAPEIAQAVPQVDPWLSNYVTWADSTRMVLDQQVRDLMAWFDDLTASAP